MREERRVCVKEGGCVREERRVCVREGGLCDVREGERAFVHNV